MRGCLIIMPNWIGDTLMALPVINHKAALEGRKPHLLVDDKLKPLLDSVSDMPILTYDRRSRTSALDAVRRIQAHSFSKVYLLPHSFRTARFAFRTRIPNRRGISKESRGIFLTERISKKLRDKSSHLIEEYAHVLETKAMAPERWQGLNTFSADHRGEGDLVFCPGAEYGPSKQWPYYQDLVKIMHPFEITVLGIAADYGNGELIRMVDPDRVRNLAGKTNIQEALEIISKSKLVISNDSGLMHVAAFVGTPVIGIFGSTSSQWTRPLGSKSEVFDVAMECIPCFKRKCPYGHYNCLKSIRAEKVADRAKAMLDKYWSIS
jgi:heptosyltransferase-2